MTDSRGERPSWQERMGLTLAEALRLPGLAGTEVVAGAGGLDRVVRYMVVDDPTDPLAVAGPDVLVVLGARLPPADTANYRALVERLDSMGTAALAYRRAEGPAPVPADVLAEADRRALPVLALPAGVRMDEVVSEVLGAVVGKQSEALALSTRMHDQFIDVALSGGGLAEVTDQLAVSLEGAAVLGLGPDREIVTTAGPAEDVEEISDWLWLLDAEAEDEMATMAPSRRVSGLRADQTVVTPADVLADADLSPADGILLVPGHHELPGGVGEYAVAPIMAGDHLGARQPGQPQRLGQGQPHALLPARPLTAALCHRRLRCGQVTPGRDRSLTQRGDDERGFTLGHDIHFLGC